MELGYFLFASRVDGVDDVGCRVGLLLFMLLSFGIARGCRRGSIGRWWCVSWFFGWTCCWVEGYHPQACSVAFSSCHYHLSIKKHFDACFVECHLASRIA